MTARNRNLLRMSGVLLSLVFTLSPGITTISWHLRHDGQMDYGGAHFAVPRWWSARISPIAIHFEKRPFTVFGPALLAWAALAPVPHPPRARAEREAFYARFAAIYWTHLLKDQEIQQGPMAYSLFFRSRMRLR